MDRPTVPQTTELTNSGRDSLQIALGFEQQRNRQLLATLLRQHKIVDATDPIPSGTDLCIVDLPGFLRIRDALATWKREEQPALAPVLLLTTVDEDKIWTQYGTMDGQIDAIHTIPSPRDAIYTRVTNLLETREYSVIAQDRRNELELYERAMDGADIGITIADGTDPELPLVYANDGFTEITGYEREEILGRNCRFLQGEGTKKAAVRRIREHLQAGEALSIELRNYRKSGEMFWNALDITPVRDENGTLTHFLGFQRDITEYRHHETLLNEYEQIVQAVDDPLFVLDLEGRVVTVNDAAKATLGIRDGDALYTSITTYFDDAKTATFEEALATVRDTEETTVCELAVTTAELREVIFQFKLQRAVIDPDERDRIIVTARDLTSVREYQDRLQVLDRVLRHNFRNELNIILGHAEHLAASAKTLSSEEVEQAATALSEAATELLEIGEASRQFNSSFDSADQTATVIDLSTLLASFETTLAQQYPIVEFTIDVPETSPAKVPEQLPLCLEQIVKNAIQYAETSKPAVTIAVTHDPELSAITLQVRDNGPGFPPEELHALNSGLETSLGHTQGISLWLTRWAVTGIGGHFEVTNHDSSGATVTLTFPEADGEAV